MNRPFSSHRSVRPEVWRTALAGHPYLPSFALLVVAVGLSVWLNPSFPSQYTLRTDFNAVTPLVLVSVAQTVIIVGGGLDLSLGSLAGLVAVAAVGVGELTGSVLLMALLALGMGTFAGALNGVVVAVGRLQPLIATYATGFIFAGLALMLRPLPGGEIPRSLQDAYRASVLGIPFSAVVIVLLAIMWVGLRRHRFGQHLFAVGGDAAAAYASGVNVVATRWVSYTVGGLLAGLAGLALAADTATADPLSGAGLTLDSIVAVVIGGTALAGGRGGALGSIAGAFVLALLPDVVFFSGISRNFQELARGGFIILALMLAGQAARVGRPDRNST
jgi:ribose transport system permease protein